LVGLGFFSFLGFGAFLVFLVDEIVDVVESDALLRERADDVEDRRSVFFFASLRALRVSDLERRDSQVLDTRRVREDMKM
jgi:hypothetical protein